VLAATEGSKEDKASWTAFLRHLKERGLHHPRDRTAHAGRGRVSPRPIGVDAGRGQATPHRRHRLGNSQGTKLKARKKLDTIKKGAEGSLSANVSCRIRETCNMQNADFFLDLAAYFCFYFSSREAETFLTPRLRSVFGGPS